MKMSSELFNLLKELAAKYNVEWENPPETFLSNLANEFAEFQEIRHGYIALVAFVFMVIFIGIFILCMIGFKKWYWDEGGMILTGAVIIGFMIALTVFFVQLYYGIMCSQAPDYALYEFLKESYREDELWVSNAFVRYAKRYSIAV